MLGIASNIFFIQASWYSSTFRCSWMTFDIIYHIIISNLFYITLPSLYTCVGSDIIPIILSSTCSRPIIFLEISCYMQFYNTDENILFSPWEKWCSAYIFHWFLNMNYCLLLFALFAWFVYLYLVLVLCLLSINCFQWVFNTHHVCVSSVLSV